MSSKSAQSKNSSSSVFAFGRGSSGELGCGMHPKTRLATTTPRHFCSINLCDSLFQEQPQTAQRLAWSRLFRGGTCCKSQPARSTGWRQISRRCVSSACFSLRPLFTHVLSLFTRASCDCLPFTSPAALLSAPTAPCSPGVAVKLAKWEQV